MRVRTELVALLMLVTVGCGATGQAGDPAAAAPPAPRAAVAAVTLAALPAPRSYDVGAGPAWNGAIAYSCLQACALLFGGSSADWACSTSATEVNRFAWYSKAGTSESCGPTGTPLPEDFNPGGSYEAAGASAYVNDWCFLGEGSINYCHAPPVVVPPPPPPAGEGDECDDRDCGSSDDEPDSIHGHDRRPKHRDPPGHDPHHRVRPAPAHAARH